MTVWTLSLSAASVEWPHFGKTDKGLFGGQVGKGRMYFDINQTTDWKNDFRLPIVYGEEGKAYQQLIYNRHKTHNSEGQMVCIEEVDFREDLQPTHIIIQISAGCMPPFTGCPGNILWVDNIKLAYSNPTLAHEK